RANGPHRRDSGTFRASLRSHRSDPPSTRPARHRRGREESGPAPGAAFAIAPLQRRCHRARPGSRVGPRGRRPAARRLHSWRPAAMTAFAPHRRSPRSNPSSCRGQRATAMVETLLAAPIVLLLGLGALQWSLLFHARSAIEYAAFEAARAGSVAQASVDAIEDGFARGLMPFWHGAHT